MMNSTSKVVTLHGAKALLKERRRASRLEFLLTDRASPCSEMLELHIASQHGGKLAFVLTIRRQVWAL